MRFPFSKYAKCCYLIALIAIVPAVFMNALGHGINLGIDFTGGTLLEYSVGEAFESRKIEEILAKGGYTGSQVTQVAAPGEAANDALTNVQIRLRLPGDPVDGIAGTVDDALSRAGAQLSARERYDLSKRACAKLTIDEAFADGTRLTYPGEYDAAAIEETLKNELGGAYAALSVESLTDENGPYLQVLIAPENESLAARALLEREAVKLYPAFSYVSMEHVGATSGTLLIRNALLSLLIALSLMLVYIAIRFDICSGIAALFGLAHDMLMMCAFMTYFQGLYQVNSSFIAAILTIVGYSINDTIVVFDRVRENKRAMPERTNTEIIDISQNQSFPRAVNSTLTTLFTIVALYLLGVDSIREFAFPLIVGLVAGTWSSMVLNGPLWARLMDRREARRRNRPKEPEPVGDTEAEWEIEPENEHE